MQMRAYSHSAVVEVQANDASSQSEILLDPVSRFLLNDALSLGACFKIVVERQKIRRAHNCGPGLVYIFSC